MTDRSAESTAPSLEEALTGCLLGGAVGDALGLPREGLSPVRARRLFGDSIRYCFVGRRGMVSDDTEHALMTACSLLQGGDSPDRFARALARRLRSWLLMLPAGAGLATLRSCLRLWCGIPPGRSGVYSAGNGPLMRAAIIGTYLAAQPERMREFIRASTRLTHTDPKAERAALIIALAASWRQRQGGARPSSPQQFLAEAAQALPETDAELLTLLERAAQPASLTDQWPRGPGGYAYDTLLAVIHTWLHGPERFGEALCELIGLGGDTDTTGAIMGGVIGANLGVSAVPQDLLAGLWEWPRGIEWMKELARRLGQPSPGGTPPPWHVAATLVRNLLFVPIVLAHGFRRAFQR